MCWYLFTRIKLLVGGQILSIPKCGVGARDDGDLKGTTWFVLIGDNKIPGVFQGS